MIEDQQWANGMGVSVHSNESWGDSSFETGVGVGRYHALREVHSCIFNADEEVYEYLDPKKDEEKEE